MSIRHITPGDLDPVLALNNANIPALGALDAVELARLATLATHPLVAELDDGTFAGFCLVLPPGADYGSVNYRWFSAHAGSLGYADFAYLDRIAVAPAARRAGVGRALYERLVADLRGAAPVLFCEVNIRPRNETSLVFHEAIGFRPVGELDSADGAKRVSLLALDLR